MLQLDVALLLDVVVVLHPLAVAVVVTTLPARMSAETETTTAVTVTALAAQKIGEDFCPVIFKRLLT